MVFRILLSFFIACSAFGAEVVGVNFADEDQRLLLNGAGLRKRPVQDDLKKALLGEKQ